MVIFLKEIAIDIMGLFIALFVFTVLSQNDIPASWHWQWYVDKGADLLFSGLAAGLGVIIAHQTNRLLVSKRNNWLKRLIRHKWIKLLIRGIINKLNKK